MKFITSRKIKLDKPLNELDKFVLRFINILKEHVEYVVISGYVSILLGRSRATEDVDIFIKPINKEIFVRLYQHLKEAGFWCLNAESEDEVYNYLKERLAVRFANQGETIPNMEVKFPKNELDEEVFTDFLEVETTEGMIKISSLERQVAFKKYYLKSQKDLEDAKHIEEVFKEHLNQEKIKKYKRILKLKYG